MLLHEAHPDFAPNLVSLALPGTIGLSVLIATTWFLGGGEDYGGQSAIPLEHGCDFQHALVDFAMRAFSDLLGGKHRHGNTHDCRAERCFWD